MISLPGVFFLSASGTRRIVTRQVISPVSRLPSHQVVGGGVVLSRLTSNRIIYTIGYSSIQASQQAGGNGVFPPGFSGKDNTHEDH